MKKSVSLALLLGVWAGTGCSSCEERDLRRLAESRLPSGTQVELLAVPSEARYRVRAGGGSEQLLSLEVGLYEDRDGDGTLAETEQVASAFVESGVGVGELQTPPLQVAESWQTQGKACLRARLRTKCDERWEMCWVPEAGFDFRAVPTGAAPSTDAR